MRFLNNIKTGNKLVGGFVFATIITIVVIVLGLTSMTSINTSLQSMYHQNLNPVIYLGKMDSAFLLLRGDVYRYLVVDNERIKTQATMESRIAEIAANLDEYKKKNQNEEEQQLLAKLDTALAAYYAAMNEFIGFADADDIGSAKKSLNTGGKINVARNNVSEVLNELTLLNENIAEQSMTDSDASMKSSQMMMIIIGAIGVIVSLALGIVISRSLTTPIGVLTRASKDLSMVGVTFFL